ncbi:MAG: S8 family serine peptidase [Hyphomicrobium sp.]
MASPVYEQHNMYFDPVDPLTDPNSNVFWYLHNTRGGLDLNILELWQEYTGDGVKVAVYDGGVWGVFPDLDGNYDASLEIPGNVVFDFNTDDGHGTQVSLIIAGENNGEGFLGVAHGSTLVGVNILTDIPDSEQNALMGEQHRFDVVNHSWGFTGSYKDHDDRLDPSTASFFAGMENAVDTGRGGLGTIMVRSGGNSREKGDDGNAHNFANSRFVVAVGGVQEDGSVASYSTPGAHLLVSSFGGDDGAPLGDASSDMIGTSFAAPMVSGIVALMLEANPNLGWRDVQDILAYSARHVGSAVGGSATGHEQYAWTFNGADNWNGGGLHYSNDYGFGLVDAHAAVRLAESWGDVSTSANEAVVSSTILTPPQNGTFSLGIPDHDWQGMTLSFTIGEDITIERLELELGIEHAAADDLHIFITSPDGTSSTLAMLTSRYDPSQPTVTLDDWTFTSNAFRGELSAGTWTLTIRDIFQGGTGSVTESTLRLYGSADTTNDVYIYTDEFAELNDGTHGYEPLDDDGGIDTFNAAAVSSDSIISLEGGTYRIDGREGGFGYGFSPEVDPAQFMIENVIGGDGSDVISGNFVANTLSGNRGDDTLDGRGGADRLIGGTGNDTYVVDHVGDTIVEDAGEGIDTIQTSVEIGSVTNVENIIMTGTVGGKLTGNAESNRLTGNIAANILDGLAGADVMSGGGGNDIYIVDDVGDVVIEAAAGGADTVRSSVRFTLAGNVERLELTGASDVAGTGNGRNNVLDGNSGSNALSGGGGNDTLRGRAGNDVLTGGLGSDRLDGGNGDDILKADAQDLALIGGAGYDIVLADATTASGGFRFALAGSGVEMVHGNAGSDVLDASGAESLGDTSRQMYGGGGDDRLIAGAGIDWIGGGQGTDTVVFAGNRTDYSVYAEHDSGYAGWTAVVHTSTGETDWIISAERLQFADQTVDAGLVRAVISGTNGHDTRSGAAAAEELYGQAGNDRLFGNGGDDILDGGAGADRLLGGDGDDVLYVDALDIVNGGAGYDQLYVDESRGSLGLTLDLAAIRVEAAFGGNGSDRFDGMSSTVGVELNGLGGDDTLIGSAVASSSLLGGSGNDVLRGGSSVDYLTGGAGNDDLTGGGGGDSFTFSDGFGRDIIRDFEAGQDRIWMTEITGLDTFNQLSIVNGATGAEVSFAGQTIVLQGLDASLVSAGDFVL